MSGEIYTLVFKGAVVKGFTADVVKAHLAKLLKADVKKTAALFSGKQIVLKKTTDRAEAARYGKALRKIGADVDIRVVKAPPKDTGHVPAFSAADQPPTQQLTPAAQLSELPESARSASKRPAPARIASQVPVIDTSGITLAPNEGDLFDPVPAVANREIDLSRFAVAENDGTYLVEPADPVVIALDLSEFSLKDNDGTALFEHQDENIPKVAVPDFVLDAPGALLANEPPQAPAPIAPDTSNINLASIEEV